MSIVPSISLVAKQTNNKTISTKNFFLLCFDFFPGLNLGPCVIFGHQISLASFNFEKFTAVSPGLS